MKKKESKRNKPIRKRSLTGSVIDADHVYDLVIPGLTEEQRKYFISSFEGVMAQYGPEICFKETKVANRFKIFCEEGSDELLKKCVADFFHDENDEPYTLEYSVKDSFSMHGLKVETLGEALKSKPKRKLKCRVGSKGITVTDIAPDYFISWDRVASSGKLLDWVLHFLEKDMDQIKIYEFARLVNDHFGGILIDFNS